MGVSHFYTRHLNMTKILVIDDEELMRKLMKKMLMRDGHDVFIARDGVDGVEQFHQINPDLVITDIIMPNKDGYEVIKAKLPVAITVLKSINTLRMPSLKGKMKAKAATIRQITVADLDSDPNRLGLKGSPTWVSKIFTPPVKGNRQIIQDDQGSAGQSIFDILKNLKVV